MALGVSSFSANREISRVLLNPKVHFPACPSHRPDESNSPPPLQSRVVKVNFNFFFLLSTTKFSQLFSS